MSDGYDDDNIFAELLGGGRRKRRRGKEEGAETAPVTLRPGDKGVALPWGDDIDPGTDPFKQALGISPAVLLAVLLMRDALLGEPDFIAGAGLPGTVSVIKVPSATWGPDIATAWTLIVAAAATARRPMLSDALAEAVRRRGAATAPAWTGKSRIAGADTFEAYEKIKNASAVMSDFREGVAKRRPIHLISSEPETFLPPEIKVAEDQRLTAPDVTANALATLATALVHPSGWPSSKLPKIPPGLAASAAAVTPLLVNLAHRPGQTPLAFLKRLTALVERHMAARIGRDRTKITLADLPGLGEAGEWGERMAADLRVFGEGGIAWSDMDRGVVLEGPPGSGKSSFAAALANTAKVAFVSASLAQWQGADSGHLGTLLGAMRRTFEEARKKAPCVLLIDEIDSFPARASVTHHYRDYVIEVVNGLLEQLDGAVDRDGVLVIGACNDARGLDAALTRAGRLERVITLSRPGAEAFEKMLRVHLNGALANVDLAPVSLAAVQKEAVGADAERWCRSARRRARVDGRPVILDDLVAEIGNPPSLLDADSLRRIAIHEAGHVIALATIGGHYLRRVVLARRRGERSFTDIDFDRLGEEGPLLTREVAYRQLRLLLAGRVAEEIVLGDACAGAGGFDNSDLARATHVAVVLAGSTGLDEHPGSLVFRGGMRDLETQKILTVDPHVRVRVALILTRSHRAAYDLLTRHRAVVERVADALLERGGLSADEAAALVGDLPPDPPDWLARLSDRATEVVP